MRNTVVHKSFPGDNLALDSFFPSWLRNPAGYVTQGSASYYGNSDQRNGSLPHMWSKQQEYP